MVVATREIEAERNITHVGDEEYEMLTPPMRSDDTSYQGVESTAPSTYEIGAAK